MKVKLERTKSNVAIIFAGVVLIGYLIVLLGLANVGQQRLLSSQQNELQLRVNQYANHIETFFSQSHDEMQHLANHKALDTFFANLNSGMSMEYGLGASLHKLDKTLVQIREHKMIEGIAVYQRITLIDPHGRIISDTHSEAPVSQQELPLSELFEQQLGSKIVATEDNGQIAVTQLTTVYRHNVAIGVLIAVINPELLKKLASALEQQQQNSEVILKAKQGDVVAWNSFDTPQSATDSANLSVNVKIVGTPFELVGRFSPIGKRELFTSTGFVAAMSLMAVPVIIGFFYLLRFNTSKLLLETQVKLSEQQQQRLARSNDALRREISRRRESELALEYQANHDQLTGLPNRKYGQNALDSAIEEAKVDGSRVLVMYSDLDNFKRINDSQGHLLGDILLRKTSKRLRSSIRDCDEVVRFSGDEFLLICAGVNSHTMAHELVQRVQRQFDSPFGVEGNEYHISTSIGVAIYPEDGEDAETLIKHADAALYQAKEQGAGTYSFFDANTTQLFKRSELLERKLRSALSSNGLQVYYQPILSLQDRKIVGTEALVRWHDEELGWVAPDEFIGIAESTGLIHQVGQQVLAIACEQANVWQRYGSLRLAVNFSTAQFRHGDKLLQQIENTLAEHHFSPELLDIEVTESLLIHNESSVHSVMGNLREMGCRLSIDDFGTGYSALSYLQQFSFKKLKIDRAFVMKLEDNEADRALVSAILVMAKALDMTVVAEGIETEWQASFLGQHQCEFGQGYLFSKPLPADEFELLLKQQASA